MITVLMLSCLVNSSRDSVLKWVLVFPVSLFTTVCQMKTHHTKHGQAVKSCHHEFQNIDAPDISCPEMMSRVPENMHCTVLWSVQLFLWGSNENEEHWVAPQRGSCFCCCSTSSSSNNLPETRTAAAAPRLDRRVIRTGIMDHKLHIFTGLWNEREISCQSNY